ncbi:MAG: hypothetical protein Q9M89_06530 [Persephonella sp.]|nr:hypothetical protein [Persephonella sp.]
MAMLINNISWQISQGSNIFNILILAIDDFFYTKNSIFAIMDKDNIFSAGIATIMTAIVIIGLIYRAEKKMFILAYESILLITVYLIGVIILYIV